MVALKAKVAVIGVGIAGQSTVFDLADDDVSKDVDYILVIDVDGERAKGVAERAMSLTKYKIVEYARFDVNDIDAVSKAVRGVDVVVNGVYYKYIFSGMKVALNVGANYIDFGADYETLVEQLKFSEEFKKRGLVGVLGMGAGPGTLNVQAKYVAEYLDCVERIMMREGWADFNDYDKLNVPLHVPYSLETILDEFSGKAGIWTDKGILLVDPLNDCEIVDFGEPLGKQETYVVDHPEVITIGEKYKHKGLKYVDYRLHFPRNLYIKYKLLADLGFHSDVPIDVGGVKVSPRAVLLTLVSRSLRNKAIKPNDYDVMRVIGEGLKDGSRTRVTVDVRTPYHEKWGVSAHSLIVGAPASIVAQYITSGKIKDPGLWNPEDIIEPIAYFSDLVKRGSTVNIAVEKAIPRKL